MKVYPFDFLFPQSWRRRAAADPDRNDAVLARVQESDPVYKAVMDHAYAILEDASLAAIREQVEPYQRAYLAGAASAMVRFIGTVESTRTRARALWEEEQKRKR
jgi:hypothetical protein